MCIRSGHAGIILYARHLGQGFIKGYPIRNLHGVQMQILRDKPQLADQTVRRTVDMGTDANGTEVMGLIDNVM